MKNLLKIIAVSFLLIFIISCKKEDAPVTDEPSLPELLTYGISDVTYNSANTGGRVVIDDGTTLISKGVCWNTTGNPTINDSKTDDGVKAGAFDTNIFPLKANMKYYVRAYATTSSGTFYGNEQTLTTLIPKLFIRAKFGNELLECYYTNIYTPESEVNSYINYVDHPSENHFYFRMYNNYYFEKSKEFQIDINRVNIDTLRTPWQNQLPAWKYNSYVNIYLVNIGRSVGVWGVYDSINYYGAGLPGDPVFVKVTGLNGDTIEGTFHGTLKTKTGLTKELTDGEFKLKFNRLNKNW